MGKLWARIKHIVNFIIDTEAKQNISKAKQKLFLKRYLYYSNRSRNFIAIVIGIIFVFAFAILIRNIYGIILADLILFLSIIAYLAVFLTIRYYALPDNIDSAITIENLMNDRLRIRSKFLNIEQKSRLYAHVNLVKNNMEYLAYYSNVVFSDEKYAFLEFATNYNLFSWFIKSGDRRSIVNCEPAFRGIIKTLYDFRKPQEFCKYYYDLKVSYEKRPDYLKQFDLYKIKDIKGGYGAFNKILYFIRDRVSYRDAITILIILVAVYFVIFKHYPVSISIP